MNTAVKMAAACLIAVATTLGPAPAMDASVSSTQIRTFKGATFGQGVNQLIWRGGIVMSSQIPEFGGLSGIAFTGSGNQLVMVTDKGNFISGHLIYDEAGAPLGFGGTHIEPIKNSKGVELPRKFAKDAEAIETIIRDGVPAAVRVGFENLTRVADFTLVKGVPSGAAREVAIPEWLSRLRTNKSLEAVCIAPPASPVAGSTILIAENARSTSDYSAFMLGDRDRGELAINRTDGLDPTDCAFLPNGDLLLLERGIAFLSFSMQVRRIPAAEVRPGNKLTGTVILKASGGDIDNMEGIAVHVGPNGDTRITIISDDNFNDWERSLLLEFSLPE